MPFIVIFILIPLTEIMVFMNVSDKIGFGMALLISLLTAILGGAIVRYQGIQTLITAQKSMSEGGLPSKELFDGLCLVAAGATLITPGFITDALGFALLVPRIRDLLRKKISKSAKFTTSEFHSSNNYTKSNDSNVIDVEYETIKEEDIDKS